MSIADAVAEQEKPSEQEPGQEMAEEDDTLEEKLTKHVHPAKAFLFGSILVTVFIAILTSILSDSGMVYAIIGFTPTIAAVLIFIFLLDGEYKDALLWLTPLAVAFLFLGLGPFINQLLGDQLDLSVLTAVNLALSYVILGIMSLIEYYGGKDEEDATLEEVQAFEPEHLGRYIHTIEDKCKAINFVIGRIYRASNGGTKGLRERLRVPREWYNEFNAIPAEEAQAQRQLALDLLGRIEERLGSLLRPEKDLFTKDELRSLKGLARDEEGRDRILDVLIVNDNDPVEEYFLGAMDFCKRVKEGLEKLK